MRRFSFLALDPRSLALSRIFTGCVLLWYLCEQFPHIALYYTDIGIGLSPHEFFYTLDSIYWWSIHALLPAISWIQFLFLVHCALCVLLIGGFKTRIVTVSTFVLTLSLWGLNPYLLFSAHSMLLTCLAFGIALDWGAAYSLDAMSGSRVKMGNSNPWWGALYFFQVGIIYLYAALSRSDSSWFDGTEVHYALVSPLMQTPMGLWLDHFTAATYFLTFAVFIFEASVWALLLLSFQISRLRFATIAGLIFMHLCFGIFLKIGFFSYTMIAFLIAGLPSDMWNAVGAIRRQHAGNEGEKFQKLSTWIAAFCASIIIAITFVNAVPVPSGASFVIRQIAEELGLMQQWSIFNRRTSAPRIPRVFIVYTSGYIREATRNYSLTAADALDPSVYQLSSYQWGEFLRKGADFNFGRVIATSLRYYCHEGEAYGTPVRALWYTVQIDQKTHVESVQFISERSCKSGE